MNILKKFKRKVKLIRHKGDKFICPFCTYGSKDLKMIGRDFQVIYDKQIIGGGRRSAGCYNCGSTDRERLILTYLKEELNIFDENKRKKILHIAPEENLSKELLKYGFDEYICGDIFTEGYSYPEYTVNINVLDIPYQENTFDYIICNHVLEHVPEDILAMRELRRVLKKGGIAILQVPISKNSAETFEDFTITDAEERKVIFGQSDHVRIYGQDYSDRLVKGGFKVERVNISKEYQNYGLNKDEDIFIGVKLA